MVARKKRVGKYQQDKRKYDKWVKEGRGQGIGELYIPWLYIWDLPSLGLSIRVPSLKSGRFVHLFSLLEFANFLLFESHPNVVDIREQFPLDVEITRKIADQNNWPHSRAIDCDMVMTTDLVVDFINMPYPRMAVQVKPSELIDRNSLTKRNLSIESLYWDIKKTKFEVFTEKKCPKAVINNLSWMLAPRWRKNDHHFLSDLAYFYAEAFSRHPDYYIPEITNELNERLTNKHPRYCGDAQCFTEVRELLAKYYLRFNINIPFQNLKGKDIQVNHKTILLGGDL